MLTKLSTSMLEFTAHCKVPIMFIANVRIMPTLPGPSPAGRKTHSIYMQIKCQYKSENWHIYLKIHIHILSSYFMEKMRHF